MKKQFILMGVLLVVLVLFNSVSLGISQDSIRKFS